MNVLLYNGPGVSKSSVEQMRGTLRSFLSISHDVILATPKMLREEPWEASTALLVIPGGRDIPFHTELHGEGNRRIRKWVENGGRYLGVCAGAYYASRWVEFEVGTEIEVSEDRELQFYPGICRGTAFPGFVYYTEEGAREVDVYVERTAWRDHWSQAPESVKLYYNGGGYFVDEDPNNVTVLARYIDLPDRPVAGVRCQVSRGVAVLWGTHPEHVSWLAPGGVGQGAAMADFQQRETKRKSLFRATLSMLGLDTPALATPPPPVKPQLLYSDDPLVLSDVAESLKNVFGQEMVLEDINDNFCLSYAAGDTLSHALNAMRIPDGVPHASEETNQDKPTRELVVYQGTISLSSLAPIFDLERYLKTLRSLNPSTRPMGSLLFYGEVVSSTQTLLDKNPKLLSCLPTNFLSLASHQVSGRGRGGNSWLSPPGCLQFSLVLRLPAKLASKVVFVQYLFGLAVVEAVRGKEGYVELGLRLKWPNDLYAEVGGGEGLEGYKKIGGILVNSSYSGGDFTLVVGCGINTTVPQPTTSLNELITAYNNTRLPASSEPLSLIQPEELLALVMAKFSNMWDVFLKEGFEPFMDAYLGRWLHSDRIVTLERTSETVRIIGITPDHGLLRTIRVNLDKNGKEIFGGPQAFSGSYVDLQPDSNSFDMLKGLLKVKS